MYTFTHGYTCICIVFEHCNLCRIYVYIYIHIYIYICMYIYIYTHIYIYKTDMVFQYCVLCLFACAGWGEMRAKDVEGVREGEAKGAFLYTYIHICTYTYIWIVGVSTGYVFNQAFEKAPSASLSLTPLNPSPKRHLLLPSLLLPVIPASEGTFCLPLSYSPYSQPLAMPDLICSR